MQIIRKYIFKQLVLPFLLAVLTLSFIFLAGYLVRAAHFIIGRGVPLSETMYVIMLAFPRMLSFTVPISLLTASMIVFGNLSANNEIRAFKASGVHPLHVMLPVFVVGLVMSFTMFVFNDQIANEAAFKLRKVTKQMLVKHPSALIEPGRFISLNEQIIFLAKEVDGNKMKDIVAYEVSEDNNPVRTIIAERGEMKMLEDGISMQIVLYQGSVSDSESKGVQAVQFQTYEFPSFGYEDIRKMRRKTRDYSLANLLIMFRNSQIPDDELTRFWTAFHDRISFAFGSFIFVFLGVPIAILVRRGEVIISFVISMIAACIYYILFVGAQSLSIRGVLPAGIALWLPNIILFAIGGVLVRKSIKS
jgi:lipopolysaccharide export system permease protein